MGVETVIIGSVTYGTVYNFLIATGINYLISRNQARTPRDTGGNRIRLQSDTQNKLPVIYGEQEIAGSIIHAELSDSNQKMHFIIALAEECSKFKSVYWNDRKLRLSTTSGGLLTTDYSSGTTYYCIGSEDYQESTNGDVLSGKIKVAFYPTGGRCTQMETTTTPLWRANRVNRTMPNVCYMYVELTYDADNRITGLPNNFRSVVEGIIPSKVLDNNPSGNYIRDKKAGDTYTINPADCILDYLTNTRYGCSIDINDIDTKAFYDHKVFCDEDFYETTDNDPNNRTYRKRYTTNIVIDTNNNLGDNLLALSVGNGSNITWKQNKFGIISYKQKTSVFNFGESNLFGGFNISKVGFKNKINELTVRYQDPRPSQTERQITVKTPNADRNQNEPRLERTISIPSCSNTKEAKRIADIILNRSRFDTYISFKTNMSAINLNAGDVFSFSHETPNWENKLFEIEKIQEVLQDNFIQLEINAREYDPNIYSQSDLIVISDISLKPNAGGSDDLVDINWTVANNESLVFEYEIDIKVASTSDWGDPDAYRKPNQTRPYVHRIPVLNSMYDLRIRALLIDGSISRYYYASGSSNPTSLITNVKTTEDASFNISNLLVTWTPPTQSGINISRYELDLKKADENAWVNQSNNISGTSESYNINMNLESSTTYDIRIRYLNSNGNYSNYAQIRATTIAREEITNLVVTGGNNSLSLTWNAPIGINVTRYEIEYKSTSSVTWLTDGNTTNLSYNISNLLSNHLYDVRVRFLKTDNTYGRYTRATNSTRTN